MFENYDEILSMPPYEVFGNAFIFLFIGAFLYGNYICGKAASNNNKIAGIVHVIRIVLFSLIINLVFIGIFYGRLGELSKFIPSLALAGLIVNLTSALFTRKSA